MATKKLRHFVVADELATTSLFAPLSNCCTCLVIKVDDTVTTGSKRKEYLGGLILIVLRQVSDFGYRLIKQFCHFAIPMLPRFRPSYPKIWRNVAARQSRSTRRASIAVLLT